MNLKNRLTATVRGIKKGKLNAHISLEWEGIPLSVVITSASTDEMRLAVEEKVEILFKASDVIIAKGLSGKLSARNIFPGRIREIKTGFPLAMVILDSHGCTLSAELTASSVDDMELNPGDEVEVVIKSSELILAKHR